MTITNDVQKLEPGNTIRLIEVDGTKFGADILRFHNETIPHTPYPIPQLRLLLPVVMNRS